jgi:cytochrome c553
MTKARYTLTLGIGVLLAGSSLWARPVMSKRMMRRPRPAIAPGDVHFRTDFAVLGNKPTMERPSADERASAGSTIAAIHGGSVSVDEDTGILALLSSEQKLLDSANVGMGASLLVVDRRKKTIYVSHRNADRVEIYAYGSRLAKAGSIATDAEPYGLALSPDGRTLLVTTVAGRSLQAFDTASHEERWSLEVGPEPRAVAISGDGRRAIVSFLGTSAAAKIDLSGEDPRMRFEAIADTHTPTERNNPMIGARNAVPERYARNAFAATFVGDTAVIAYQQSTPLAATGRVESRGTYGGSAEGNPPILHRLAFVADGWNQVGRAHVRAQMPRAMAYDARSDALFIADLANDEIIALEQASQPDTRMGFRRLVRKGSDRCGPSGIAIADGGDLLVRCAFSRNVARMSRPESPSQASTAPIAWSTSIGTSHLSAAAQRGRALFHQGNDARLSQSGGMSCGNCHPEGRNDGLSWRIEGKELQTPLLSGRMVGTHPFKWDGQDRDLQTSLLHTVRRLGGTGISVSDARDLKAYLESMPKLRAPERDQVAVHRGKKLFESKELGCRSCHSGPNYSDGKSYDFSDDLDKVNTPSLHGLAASAPYYHDGSAASLRDLVLENGSVHGMGHLSELEPREVDDLVAFLETL